MTTLKAPKALFILKQRMPGAYGSWSYSAKGEPLTSGLYISALQMINALNELQIECKLVHVVDNNSIDREVNIYKPTHVFIEAFWVVPEKFDVLKRLHPSVKWLVRNHSKPTFLANEGGMIGWAIDYMKRGVIVASNSSEAARDFEMLATAAGADPCNSVYLPNYYKSEPPKRSTFRIGWQKFKRWLGFNEGHAPTAEIKIGCFGAVRPMKNHLTQAVASIKIAEELGLKLRFWINGNRIEGKGESFLRSLRELFARYPKHELVEIDWTPHEDFVKLIATMDIVTQVSNSETFNIVAADAVGQGVPVVGSAEIPWLDKEYCADVTDACDIANKLSHVWENSRRGLLQQDQLIGLRKYTDCTKTLWAKFLNH